MKLCAFKLLNYAALQCLSRKYYIYASSTFDLHSVLQLLCEKIKHLICF